MKAGPALPLRTRLALAAVLLYPVVSAFWLPAFVVPMRQRLARNMPSEWAAVSNDGSFQYASPYVVGNHLFESGTIALRVRQVLLHGFPYDPFTGDRGLSSWLFGSLLYYFMAACWALVGGGMDLGTAMAAGVAGALRLHFFYRFFKHALGDVRRALVAAFVLLYFSDALVWPFSELHGALAQAWSGRLPDLLGGLVQLPRRLFNPAWVQDYARLPSVGLSVVGTCWTLASVYRLSTRDVRRTRAAVLAGLAAGLLSFTHFFDWSLTVASVVLYLAASRAAGLPAAGRWNLRWAAGVACAASAAYALGSWALLHGSREALIDRMGDAVRVRPENIVYLLYAAWFHRRAGRDPERRALWTLCACVEASVFLLCNAPLVLGFDLSFARHYHMQANLLMVLGGASALLAAEAAGAFAARHAAVLLCAVAAWDVAASKSWADKYFKLHGAPRAIEASMRWLDGSAPEGAVVLTLSSPALAGIPIWTRARTLVTHYSPTAGHPGVSGPENLRRFALMLKTAGADLDAFLAERWFPALTETHLYDDMTFYARNHAIAQRERTEWPYFLGGNPLAAPDALRAGADALRSAFAEQPPLAPPFYLWLGRGEERLLRGPPEGRGGRLVYSEGGVRIFEFR